MNRFRQPLLRGHGRWVVGTLCGYEVVALLPGSPLPTISQMVRRFPPFGWAILGALAHHWLLEENQ